MAYIDVTIFCPVADKGKADLLSSAFPGGEGMLTRAICSTPSQSNLALADEWLGTGAMDTELVAAFRAAALLWGIKEQLVLADHPLIAPYVILSLEGTDVFQQLVDRGMHFIEPE